MSLTWHASPVGWSVDEQLCLSITAGPITDLFVDPQGAPAMINAPRLLGAVSGDFQFSAQVEVGFSATFDAGVLLVWLDEGEWAKLCFEYSPQHQPMVVSVVTRGKSDDANGFVVATNQIWLRVARIGTAWAFHASGDGQTWDLIRHFPLSGDKPASIGFLAQSPTGAGCTAKFMNVHFSPQRLADLRNGE
jgi:regulation of enolase protein 1 (concanavalin A-like superfamily)